MDVERQLPREREIFLDHVAHFVSDREAASRALTRAGFSPTPVSIQSNAGKLTGTGNITAMLTRGYIEVLFTTADTPLAQELDLALARFSGVHLIALSVSDAVSESERLRTAGFRTTPIVELRRTVDTESGTAEAAFTVARIEPGQMPEGRIQTLTHHTEHAVWQKRWLAHPNGARGLVDVLIVVPDIAEAEARYARFIGRKSRMSEFGCSFALDRGAVQLTDARSFGRLVPGIAPPGLPFIGAYALTTDSLIATANVLRDGGNTFEQRGNMLVAPFPEELGAGAWIFVEQANNLPWRT